MIPGIYQSRLLTAIGVFAALVVAVLTSSGCRRAESVGAGNPSEAGWEWFRSGEFNLAEKSFTRAARLAGTNTPARVEALYGLAVTWHLRRPDGDDARAAQLYREVMTTAPHHDLAAWSALGLARLPEARPPGQEPPHEDRIAAYQAVIDRFPKHTAAEEAFLLQQALRLTGAASDDEVREVLAKLDAFMSGHPDSPYVSTAWSLIEQAATWLRLPDRRLEAILQQWQTNRRLEAILQQWQTTPVDPAATNAVNDLSTTYWRIATVAEFEVGDFDLAREYYGKLITEYPTQQRVFLAKQELRRMAELEARLRGGGTP